MKRVSFLAVSADVSIRLSIWRQLFPELDLFKLFSKLDLEKSCYVTLSPQRGDIYLLLELGLDDKTDAKTTLLEPWFIPDCQHWGGRPGKDLPEDPAALWYQISKFQTLGGVHIQGLTQSIITDTPSQTWCLVFRGDLVYSSTVWEHFCESLNQQENRNLRKQDNQDKKNSQFLGQVPGNIYEA